MAVRSKDIAKQIGVSEATFSLVINGKPGISEKTREKVLRAVRELGYDYLIQAPSPSPAVSSNTIGFVLFKNKGELLGANSFFPLILEGIESTAREAGYSLSVINIERAEIETEINYIRNASCQGFVVFATEMHHADLEYFRRTGLPFVLFDNYFVDERITSVKVNNEQGTWLLVQYLVGLGHTRIGYLSSGLEIRSFQERQACALKAMEYFGIKKPEKDVYTIGYPNENAERGMARLLETHSADQLPTAFLADNDLVSAGAMLSLRRAGYRIPEDFSFAGFDDRPICTLLDPKLTTLQLPRDRFGAEAVRQLIYNMDHPEASPVCVQINGDLVIRDSCSNYQA